MPRTARASAANYCYHVLNRGNNRAAVFHKDGDYEAFVGLLRNRCQKSVSVSEIGVSSFFLTKRKNELTPISGHPQARLDTQGGATRYDGKAFTHFTQKEGLPSNNVYSMFEDREGRIWFGSVAHFGTSRYDGKTFTSFSPK